MNYADAYAAWRRDPQAWWANAAEGITWTKRWDACSTPRSAPSASGSPARMLNTCYNCLDRHVEAGRGEQPALIWDSPMTGTRRDLHLSPNCCDRTAKLAGALAALGVGQGDRVVIYMPMVPEAAIAMLACARLGAVHSVVFGGFAAAELATRIADAKPKVIVSASCGLEPGRVVKYKPLLDAAIAMSPHKPDACLILQRPQAEAPLTPGRDHDLLDAEAAAAAARLRPRRWPPIRCISCTPPAPPASPRASVRDNGGHAVVLWNSMKMIYGLDAGDVWWAASDVGWVVGHSYIVYAPLLRGCTSVMYEGKPVGTPDAGAFWRVIAQHRVKVLFTAPTAMRAIKQQDPEGKLLRDYDLSQLGGAVSRRRALRSADRHLGRTSCCSKPVVDHWWQTETGWAITAGFRQFGLFPFKPGSGGRPMPRLRPARAGRRRQGAAAGADRQPVATPAAAARLRPDAVAERRRLPHAPTWPTSPAGTAPATPAWSTRMATSGSWAAPTTSSTSPAIACPPDRWRKCSPRTRTSPNAR